MWFLSKLKRITEIEATIEQFGSLEALPKNVLKDAKDAGFSDLQIAKILNIDELTVRDHRKGLHIVPYVKRIDTLAGEFPCDTNNLYLTYNA